MKGSRFSSSFMKCGCRLIFFFFNDTATTEIYTLSLHDALPIYHLYYRDVSDGQVVWSQYPTALTGTSVTLLGKVFPLRVYEFQIAAFNLTGEARLALTERQVAQRKLPGNPVIHQENYSNGSNNIAR